MALTLGAPIRYVCFAAPAAGFPECISPGRTHLHATQDTNNEYWFAETHKIGSHG